jgi:hypothetical protein
MFQLRIRAHVVHHKLENAGEHAQDAPDNAPYA